MKSIIKKISQGLLVPLAILSLGVAVVAPSSTALAARSTGSCNPSDLSVDSGAACAQGNGQSSTLFGEGSIFQSITNILLFLIGAISVIMLIIGGIRYVISGGDQNQVTSAKNTILYAIVGIVIAFLAYAAVNFVIGALQP